MNNEARITTVRGYRAAKSTRKRNPDSIFTRIASARTAAGMTREELSQKSGISVAVLAGLESGKVTTTTSKRLLSIAGALDTTLDQLFFAS